ncbi:hypothetical protein BDY24DRAFT_392297 [Mrakia frigida]|uniref:uncharacterized protein n=1 Tax=Mrakia frigida TaxID=29902 RepID=UPI003FCC089A
MLIDSPEEGRNEPAKKGESSFAPSTMENVEDSSSSDPPPPSYTPSSSTSTTSPLPPSLPTALLSASKSSHISLSQSNSSINTCHIIDLNIQVPLQALPPARKEELVDGERVNGYWSSTNGSVKVKLGVKGKEGEEGKRVRAKAESSNGSVRIEVVSRTKQNSTLSQSFVSRR